MAESRDYNTVPVYYCKSCLSLGVKSVASGLDLDYCKDCGSTDIEQTHIEDWQKLYRERYGFDYLTKELNSNGRSKGNSY